MPKKAPSSEIDQLAGRRLRATREALRMKQNDFASSIGAGRGALAMWESGRSPDVRAMVRLFERHGVPIEWIYLGLLRNVPFHLAREFELHASDLITNTTLTSAGSPGASATAVQTKKRPKPRQTSRGKPDGEPDPAAHQTPKLALITA